MFSQTLEVLTDFKTENPALRDSLSFLNAFSGEGFNLRRWDENRIAVAVAIEVDLPSVANHDQIDIRAVEPILIVFDIDQYPTKAPTVFTDRLDFPKNKLAHLYIAKEGRTPAFCYVRGDRDQWYANKTIKDLLVRIQNWLQDAATGQLSEDGEQFEPLRLEGYSGMIIYDYDYLASVVQNNRRIINELNFALGLFERIKDEEVASFRLLKLITPGTLDEVVAEFETEKKKDLQNATKRHLHYGYVVWSDTPETYAEYNIALPKTWSEFTTFCSQFGIDYRRLETFISTVDGNYLLHFPVIVGIRRPKPLIGYSSNIEFLNFRFRVDTGDTANGKFVNDVEVQFQAHNQPLTAKLANKISNVSSTDGLKLVLGCGALGSKIGMHFGRSGNHKLAFFDPDALSSHNMVRHALLASKIGVNKAKALSDEIKSMFPTEDISIVGSMLPFNSSNVEAIKAVSRVFDFTASPAVFNQLVTVNTITHVGVASSSISDFGHLGITFVEGINRNPRIDDLQVSLYALHDTNTHIREWLRREQTISKKENVTVPVGVGCNSETTVLSDIKVSSHAAFAAGVLEREMHGRKKHGSIFINQIVDGSSYAIKTHHHEISPFDIYLAANEPTWSIRFRPGIVNQMRKTMVNARRKETGGVFAGVANFKTKTIHVTNLIPAPPDSQATSVCFCRGVNGLPRAIETINKNSGGQLGYIGEWHSHPHGPDGLSSIDLASVAKFKAEFETLTTPLPVFLTVITPSAFLPCVF